MQMSVLGAMMHAAETALMMVSPRNPRWPCRRTALLGLSGLGPAALQRVTLLLGLLACATPAAADDKATCRATAGDDAIAVCSRLIKLKPKDAAAYVNRGLAYRDKHDYDRAVTDLNEAIRLNPKNAATFYARGGVYVSKGDYDRALTDYNEALRLDPKLTPAAEAKAGLVAKVEAEAKAAAEDKATADAKAAAEAKAAAASKAAFDASRERHFNSVAVVIGNSEYQETPEVTFASNDAQAIKEYLLTSLGFREDNIHLMLNLGHEQMDQLFGAPYSNAVMAFVSERRKERRGDVFVYYSGHGVLDPQKEKQAYLLPVDVAPDHGAEAGISLKNLQDNLERVRRELPSDRSVVLMLDACFGGRLLASSVAMSMPAPALGSVPQGFVRVIGAACDKLAYWNDGRQLSLFTSLFLNAVAGAADGKDFGDRNGQVEGLELEDYLSDRLPAEARRTNGQQQLILDGLGRMLWAPAVTRATAAAR